MTPYVRPAAVLINLAAAVVNLAVMLIALWTHTASATGLVLNTIGVLIASAGAWAPIAAWQYLESLAASRAIHDSAARQLARLMEAGQVTRVEVDPPASYRGKYRIMTRTIPAAYWRAVPAVHNVARKVCHDAGQPWTDPRSGITYPAPVRRRPRKPKAKP